MINRRKLFGWLAVAPVAAPAAVMAIANAAEAMEFQYLMEEGQRATDPVGAVQVYPGGIVWVDARYDERIV